MQREIFEANFSTIAERGNKGRSRLCVGNFPVVKAVRRRDFPRCFISGGGVFVGRGEFFCVCLHFFRRLGITRGILLGSLNGVLKTAVDHG